MARPIEEVFPPDKYDYIPRVAVFKTHTRVKNGRLVKVTKDDLEETAAVHNKLFDRYGRFSPFSKGHTLDAGPGGSEVDEKDQPDTCGGGVNLYVEKSPDPDEDDHILYCTWAVPKEEKEDVLKQYVSISPEFYPSKNWIYPFSLLKSSAPEIPDMPIIPLRYSVELKPGEEAPYSLVIDHPFRYSQEKPVMPADDMKDDVKKDMKPEDKEMDKAKDDAKKGAVSDKSDLAEIKQMLASLQPLIEMAPDLMQLVQLMKEGGDDEDGDDLMKPTDKDEPEGKDAPQPAEKDSMKGMGSNPVKFETSMPSSTNVSIPSFDKDDYAMTRDEVVKYQAKLDAQDAQLKQLKMDLEATQKVGADLYKAKRKADAEKIVYSLENEFLIDFASAEIKKEEIDLISNLDEKQVPKWVERIKVRYAKKLPNNTGVKEVAKYSINAEPDVGAKTPEEAQARALETLRKMAEAKKN